MVVDQRRNYLYSAGGEKIIHCQDLSRKVTVCNIKTSNCQPLKLEIDEDLQRLYCATREGLVILFDISEDALIMIHTIKLVRTVPSQQIGNNYVKSLDLDNHRNILMCQMKQGQIYCIQLINQRQVKSTIIEDIDSYGGGDKKDKGENKDNIA